MTITLRPILLRPVFCSLLSSLFLTILAQAQTLPAAPVPSSLSTALSSHPDLSDGPAQASATQQSPAATTTTAPGPGLTRADAERMALTNNPRVSVSHLLALAQHQVVRESRSAELPTLAASLTAQDANDASRISSGSLSASRLFTRVGGGVTFSQLITDFGRTPEGLVYFVMEELHGDSLAMAIAKEPRFPVERAINIAAQCCRALHAAHAVGQRFTHLADRTPQRPRQKTSPSSRVEPMSAWRDRSSRPTPNR